MLKMDFHVHTIYSRHSLLWKFGLIDGLCSPGEMVAYARKKGLTGICLTDHNYIVPQRISRELSREHGILVISGAEVNVGKREYIIIGSEKIPPSGDLEEIREYADNENAILIAPHPGDPLGRGHRDFRFFDAVEVINGFGSLYDGELQDAAKVTGSDSHIEQMLGYSYTLLEGDCYDDVVEAIRKRATRPCGSPFPKSILMNYYMAKWKKWIGNIRSKVASDGSRDEMLGGV